MTEVFNEAGEPVQVTVLEAGPCTVVQKKVKAKEGYDAVQLGFVEVTKEKRVQKPRLGHFKKAGTKNFRYLNEFRVEKPEEFEVGKAVTCAIFKKGTIVDVRGMTKGKGFQGVIKRCGKKGGPAAHGSKFHRTTGSVGMRTWPGRVLPGTGMPGQMGAKFRTIKNLEIFDVDAEKNLLFIRGAVPGANNGILRITVA